MHVRVGLHVGCGSFGGVVSSGCRAGLIPRKYELHVSECACSGPTLEEGSSLSGLWYPGGLPNPSPCPFRAQGRPSSYWNSQGEIQTVLPQPRSGSHFSPRNSTHTALGAPEKSPLDLKPRKDSFSRVGTEASSSEEEIAGAEGLTGDALRP